MAYIGKVKITSEWEKLEDLVKAQVSGQSSFVFDTSKKYSVMSDSKTQSAMFGAYVCNATSKPSEEDDGEYLTDTLFGVYEPASGADLWVKTRGNTTEVKVSVSEI